MSTLPLLVAAWILVWAALALAAAAAAVSLRAAWTASKPKARAAWLAAGLAAAAWLFAVDAGRPARGGHDNEHDFAATGLDFLTAPRSFGELRRVFAEKEASALAVRSATERLAGMSLAGTLAGHKLLLAAAALLLASALLRAGATLPGAALGAGLVALNFHTAVAAHAFATTAPILFLLSLSLWLSAGLLRTKPGPLAGPGAAAGAFLVLAARFEIFPPAALLLVACAWPSRRAHARTAAGLAAACLFWKLFLEPLAETPSLLASPWRSLAYQFGQENFSRAFGGDPSFWAAAGAALALAAPLAVFLRLRSATFTAWTAACGAWALYAAAIYIPLALFPLHHSRHQLYLLIPFALCAGAAWSAIPRRAGAVAVILVLAAYAAGQVRALDALAPHWRTHDAEWNFLLDAENRWPAGCRAFYPGSDHRAGVIAKFFPSRGDCVLAYESARHQVADFYPPAYDEDPPPRPPASGPDALRAEFAHRWFTDWHGPWQSGKRERLDPVTVRLRFYPVEPADAVAPKGRLDERTHYPARWRPGSWRDKPYAREAYEGSVEECYKSAMSEAIAGDGWNGALSPRARACLESAAQQPRK